MAATVEAPKTPATGTATTTEFNFGSGMPDPKTFPSEALAAAAQRVILREGRSLVRYPDQRGYVPLREIAVSRFRRNHDLDVPVGDIVLTTGSMQADTSPSAILSAAPATL